MYLKPYRESNQRVTTVPEYPVFPAYSQDSLPSGPVPKHLMQRRRVVTTRIKSNFNHLICIFNLHILLSVYSKSIMVR
jgi:hypothetical protein